MKLNLITIAAFAAMNVYATTVDAPATGAVAGAGTEPAPATAATNEPITANPSTKKGEDKKDDKKASEKEDKGKESDMSKPACDKDCDKNSQKSSDKGKALPKQSEADVKTFSLEQAKALEHGTDLKTWIDSHENDFKLSLGTFKEFVSINRLKSERDAYLNVKGNKWSDFYITHGCFFAYDKKTKRYVLPEKYIAEGADKAKVKEEFEAHCNTNSSTSTTAMLGLTVLSSMFLVAIGF